MEFIITVPASYPAERSYILSVIFYEFLGLEYIIQQSGNVNVCISDKEKKRRLIIPDGLFAISEEKWLTPESLPNQPLEVWTPRAMGFDCDVVLPPVPIIYGARNLCHNETNNSCNSLELWLPVDIFGSCFFMLTRYEEVVKSDRDEHVRFPTEASLAYQEKFADRPIVNEYLEILWACLQKLWPGLKRRNREYRFLLSHDVDDIFAVVGKPWKKVIRRIGGDLLFRHDPTLAFRSLKAACRCRDEIDPCNTFDFLMALSEKHGIISTFNFMADLGITAHDQRYNIEHPWARHCLRSVIQRGHLIGFHPTYGSYLDVGRTKTEFLLLKNAAEKEGATQNEWGGRQHFLRWQNPETWQSWEDAGLNYDSTIGFSDIIGFRTGCCYEYPVFNLKEKTKLNLRERSLIVMEGSVADRGGMITEELMGEIFLLKRTCQRFAGDFTLLWHNGTVISRGQRVSYRSTLSSLC